MFVENSTVLTGPEIRVRMQELREGLGAAMKEMEAQKRAVALSFEHAMNELTDICRHEATTDACGFCICDYCGEVLDA
jgi:hypothetical protein